MSIKATSSVGDNLESKGIQLTAINEAVRGMYSKEVEKLTFGMEGAKPEVVNVMTGAIIGGYVLGILDNDTKFNIAANDNDYQLQA